MSEGWTQFMYRAHAREDLRVDPIRREILRGRPLVVLATPDLQGHVREALQACGRTGDLHIVHLNDRHFLPVGLSGASRRPDLDALEELRPGRAADAITRAVTDPMAGLGCLPALGPGEGLGPSSVVVVLGVREDRVVPLDYAFWLATRARAAAEAAGRAVPLLAVEPQLFRGDALYDVEQTIGTAHYGDGPIGCVMVDLADPDGPDMTCTEEDSRRWAGLLGAWDAAHPVALGPGTAACDVGGRRVVARVVEEEGSLWVEAFELRPDGGCAGISVKGARGEAFADGADDEPGPGRLARIVARRGLAPFQVRTLMAEGVDDPVGRLLEPGRGPGGQVPADVRALAEGRLDEPLGRALARCEGAEAIRLLLADGGHARARREFVLTWPFVADALLDPGVRAAVDGGGETLPLMAGRLGVPLAIMRRLVGHPCDPCSARTLDIGRNGKPWRILSEIGHDRLPARGDRVGWCGLLGMVSAIEEIETYALAALPDAMAARLILGIPGRDWLARSAEVFDGPRRDAVPDVSDMVTGFHGWLGAVGGEGIEADAALAMLAGHRSLSALLDASIRWHAEPRLTAAPGEVPHDAAWPVPFDPVDLGDGWTAVALADMQALRDEGGTGADGHGMAGLSHCVGGYGAACLEGRSLIVSLRRGPAGAARRVSTVELVPGGEGWEIGGMPYGLSQHRGSGNGTPGTEATERLWILRGRLAEGSVPIRDKALKMRPRTHATTQAMREEAQALLPLWRRILPKGLSRLSADGLVAMARGLDAPRQGAEGC